MSIATWVLLHVVHPSLAPSGLVLGIKDNSLQVCVPSNQVLSGMSISLLLLSGSALSTWMRKCARGGWRLVFLAFSLATNLVLSPEFMMDTSLFIVVQLERVMINVPSASKLAPSMTFERLVRHQDVAFVICVTLQDVIPILLLAGHHLYSWPESVLNVEFPIKNARDKPLMWSRPVSTPWCVFRVIIACNILQHTLQQTQQLNSLILSSLPTFRLPKNGKITLWSSTNGSIPYILVLAGSESSWDYWVHFYQSFIG